MAFRAWRQDLDNQERILYRLAPGFVALAGRGDVGFEIGVGPVRSDHPGFDLRIARALAGKRSIYSVTNRMARIRCASGGGVIAPGEPPISS